MLLPDDFAERLRAIFSRDDFVGHKKSLGQRAIGGSIPCPVADNRFARGG
jgi:hypothetical protein